MPKSMYKKNMMKKKSMMKKKPMMGKKKMMGGSALGTGPSYKPPKFAKYKKMTPVDYPMMPQRMDTGKFMGMNTYNGWPSPSTENEKQFMAMRGRLMEQVNNRGKWWPNQLKSVRK